VLALPPPGPCTEQVTALAKNHQAILFADRGRLAGCIRRRPARVLADCSDPAVCSGYTEAHLNGPLAAFSLVGSGRCAWSTVKVVDLRTGAERLSQPVARLCGGPDVGGVERIILRGGGAVAFAWRGDDDLVEIDMVDERGKRVLDRGRIPSETLVRLGDRLVWSHRGHTRSAAFGRRLP
jgi:hypothetical protein